MKMDQNFNKILKIIDFYCEIIENPEVLREIDINCLKKTFQACLFIENAVKKIKEEKKEIVFESHLNAWMSRKKKTIVYKCFNFKNACDTLLEFCLKEDKISNDVIDEMLKIYIHHCGSVRFEANVNHILTHSMRANALLDIFKNLEISESDIDDEVLIASWEHEIKVGKQKKVNDFLKDMFDKEEIPRLIELAYKSETSSPINILILDFLSKKLEDYNILLYTELKNNEKKVLLKLLMDNSQFQLTFVDATFYIGRNMEKDEDEDWITSTEITYNDLKKIILILLDGPRDIYQLIVDRIKLAKELDAVWEDVERDCIL
ncbi:uncharacterized protein LOC116416801 [Nasonia vitripennis]|uniref:Uncharacterized protein n=1 Tax=Nasonia vitripennis TaxID=7425 RepID=A0A7M7Q6H4_NASVI|nr:uncharacterized protein LOC116416801 [Nasonia vitripennis]